jgi:UDP-N-acetylmuramoyl-tripeptide--D-alanyl-D-alanine ligase
VVWFGVASSPGAPHTSAHGIEIDDGTVSFRLDNGMPIRLNAAGRHQVHAALAAVAVGRLLGMADEEIRAGLETYRSAPMRSQVERYDGLTLINDAYNASPASMRAAIELLGEWRRPGRRTLVCGDMKELGRDEQRLHGELGEQIARCRGIDRCVAVGPLAECLVAAARRAGMNDASLVHCDSAEQAADLLAATLEQNEIVLVKGSRAMRLELVVERLRARFGIPSAAA